MENRPLFNTFKRYTGITVVECQSIRDFSDLDASLQNKIESGKLSGHFNKETRTVRIYTGRDNSPSRQVQEERIVANVLNLSLYHLGWDGLFPNERKAIVSELLEALIQSDGYYRLESLLSYEKSNPVLLRNSWASDTRYSKELTAFFCRLFDLPNAETIERNVLLGMLGSLSYRVDKEKDSGNVEVIAAEITSIINAPKFHPFVRLGARPEALMRTGYPSRPLSIMTEKLIAIQKESGLSPEEFGAAFAKASLSPIAVLESTHFSQAGDFPYIVVLDIKNASGKWAVLQIDRPEKFANDVLAKGRTFISPMRTIWLSNNQIAFHINHGKAKYLRESGNEYSNEFDIIKAINKNEPGPSAVKNSASDAQALRIDTKVIDNFKNSKYFHEKHSKVDDLLYQKTLIAQKIEESNDLNRQQSEKASEVRQMSAMERLAVKITTVSSISEKERELLRSLRIDTLGALRSAGPESLKKLFTKAQIEGFEKVLESYNLSFYKRPICCSPLEFSLLSEKKKHDKVIEDFTVSLQYVDRAAVISEDIPYPVGLDHRPFLGEAGVQMYAKLASRLNRWDYAPIFVSVKEMKELGLSASTNADPVHVKTGGEWVSYYNIADTDMKTANPQRYAKEVKFMDEECAVGVDYPTRALLTMLGIRDEVPGVRRGPVAYEELKKRTVGMLEYYGGRFKRDIIEFSIQDEYLSPRMMMEKVLDKLLEDNPEKLRRIAYLCVKGSPAFGNELPPVNPVSYVADMQYGELKETIMEHWQKLSEDARTSIHAEFPELPNLSLDENTKYEDARKLFFTLTLDDKCRFMGFDGKNDAWKDLMNWHPLGGPDWKLDEDMLSGGIDDMFKQATAEEVIEKYIEWKNDGFKASETYALAKDITMFMVNKLNEHGIKTVMVPEEKARKILEKERGSEGEGLAEHQKKAEFQLSNGTVYGYQTGDTIYLTPKGVNPNTPIHEYAHLWAKVYEKLRPDEWESLKKELMTLPQWKEIAESESYSFIESDENRLAGEVLATIVGNKGEELMLSAARDTLEEGKRTDESVVKGAEYFRQLVTDMAVKDVFDAEGMERTGEVTLKVLKDFAEGKGVKISKEEGEKLAAMAEDIENKIDDITLRKAALFAAWETREDNPYEFVVDLSRTELEDFLKNSFEKLNAEDKEIITNILNKTPGYGEDFVEKRINRESPFNPDIETLLVNDLTVGGDVLDRALFYLATKDMNDAQLQQLRDNVRKKAVDFYSNMDKKNDLPGHKDIEKFVDKQLHSWFRPWTRLAGKLEHQLDEIHMSDSGPVSLKDIEATARDAMADPAYANYINRELKGWIRNRCADYGLDYTKLPEDLQYEGAAETYRQMFPEYVKNTKIDTLTRDAILAHIDKIIALYPQYPQDPTKVSLKPDGSIVRQYGEFEYEQIKGGFERSKNLVLVEELDGETLQRKALYSMSSDSYGEHPNGPYVRFWDNGNIRSYEDCSVRVGSDNEFESDMLSFTREGIVQEKIPGDYPIEPFLEDITNEYMKTMTQREGLDPNATANKIDSALLSTWFISLTLEDKMRVFGYYHYNHGNENSPIGFLESKDDIEKLEAAYKEAVEAPHDVPEVEEIVIRKGIEERLASAFESLSDDSKGQIYRETVESGIPGLNQTQRSILNDAQKARVLSSPAYNELISKLKDNFYDGQDLEAIKKATEIALRIEEKIGSVEFFRLGNMTENIIASAIAPEYNREDAIAVMSRLQELLAPISLGPNKDLTSELATSPYSNSILSMPSSEGRDILESIIKANADSADCPAVYQVKERIDKTASECDVVIDLTKVAGTENRPHDLDICVDIIQRSGMAKEGSRLLIKEFELPDEGLVSYETFKLDTIDLTNDRTDFKVVSNTEGKILSYHEDGHSASYDEESQMITSFYSRDEQMFSTGVLSAAFDDIRKHVPEMNIFELNGLKEMLEKVSGAMNEIRDTRNPANRTAHAYLLENMLEKFENLKSIVNRTTSIAEKELNQFVERGNRTNNTLADRILRRTFKPTCPLPSEELMSSVAWAVMTAKKPSAEKEISGICREEWNKFADANGLVKNEVTTRPVVYETGIVEEGEFKTIPQNFAQQIELTARFNGFVYNKDNDMLLLQKDGKNLISLKQDEAMAILNNISSNRIVLVDGEKYCISNDELFNLACGFGQYLKSLDAPDAEKYVVLDIKTQKLVATTPFETLLRNTLREANNKAQEKSTKENLSTKKNKTHKSGKGK